jgi:hypothetical protein
MYEYTWHGYALTIYTPNGEVFFQGDEASELYDLLEAIDTDEDLASVLSQYEHLAE